MEQTLLEMQENLTDGLFIEFASIDEDCYYSLTKSDELKFLDDKTVLCACSGMNPRGEVARVSVYDLSVEYDDIEYCCIVASGGDYKKFIDLAKNNNVIAVNGCDNCCPENILKTKDATVEYNLNVSELLKKNNMKAQCTVRINENDEKCVEIIKNEILKIKKEI